jgi:hypothetical protein
VAVLRRRRFSPEANVAKMAAGTPLTDADRWPWLDRLTAEMKAIEGRGADAVLACSALRQAYRDRISRAGDVRYVHLSGDHDTIAMRLAAGKIITCRRRCSRASWRRSKRRPMRSSSTVRDTPFRCRSRRSVSALKLTRGDA